MRISDWSSDVCSSISDRECQNQRGSAQAVDDHVDTPEEIGAHAVHLVGETDARHAVLVSLAPHRLRLRLNAGNAVEQADRTVKQIGRASCRARVCQYV